MDVIDFAEALAAVGRRVLMPPAAREGPHERRSAPRHRTGAKEGSKGRGMQSGTSRRSPESQRKQEAPRVASPGHHSHTQQPDEPTPHELLLRLLDRWLSTQAATNQQSYWRAKLSGTSVINGKALTAAHASAGPQVALPALAEGVEELLLTA